uniref:Dolichyl-diphosphooligosaccharide--protein glycosyltransferase subunit KCP2 n=2 Tax=Callorhinchus milii TaxID=7868 RepID=A0A4W3JVW1_CALMI
MQVTSKRLERNSFVSFLQLSTFFLDLFFIQAINNLENMIFGMGFEATFFPEVLSCFVLALYTSYQVHPMSCSCA